MSKRSPKTTGTEWLFHSMAAFNGSGYADKSSPDSFYQSYVMYKAWKNQPEAVNLARRFQVEAMYFAEQLYKAAEPGHTPSEKAMNSFRAFCDRASLL